MELDIHAGKRVLYKHHNQWKVGTLEKNELTRIDEKGLYLRIVDKDNPECVYESEINQIFFDGFELEEWAKTWDQALMSKEKYIEFINSDIFDRATENAYVSDGEYGYYPISKYTETWIRKQPFDYVLRV